MVIFDKAAWHIDAGEDKSIVLERFELLLNYLKCKDMLTPDGMEILALGIDTQISLNEKMVNELGNDFLEKNIDIIISSSIDEIKELLK